MFGFGKPSLFRIENSSSQQILVSRILDGVDLSEPARWSWPGGRQTWQGESEGGQQWEDNAADSHPALASAPIQTQRHGPVIGSAHHYVFIFCLLIMIRISTELSIVGISNFKNMTRRRFVKRNQPMMQKAKGVRSSLRFQHTSRFFIFFLVKTI